MAGFIENIKGAFENAFHKGGESVLGIDISSSTIKVVQLRKKNGQAVLETYGELALGPYAGVDAGKATRLGPDVMAQALSDLMREAKVTTNKCGVAIPLSSSLINVISMPDMGMRRLKEMVPIEMRKYVPVNISEVMLDWRIISKDDTDEDEDENEDALPKAAVVAKKFPQVEVLVVAIHKDIISKFQQIVKRAGLAATFFEIEVFSTIRGVLEGGTGPVVVVDFGAGTTKIYIIERRVLRESHIINRGAQDITLALSKSMGISSEKADDLKRMYGLLKEVDDTSIGDTISLVLDSMLAEVGRMVRTYQQKHHKNIKKVILTGGGAGLKGIADKAFEVLETEVVVADPFKKVTSPAFLDDVLAEAGPEFAVCVGVALRKLEEES